MRNVKRLITGELSKFPQSRVVDSDQDFLITDFCEPAGFGKYGALTLIKLVDALPACLLHRRLFEADSGHVFGFLSGL